MEQIDLNKLIGKKITIVDGNVPRECVITYIKSYDSGKGKRYEVSVYEVFPPDVSDTDKILKRGYVSQSTPPGAN